MNKKLLKKHYTDALNYKNNKNYMLAIEKYKQIIDTKPNNIYKYYIELADIYMYEEVKMYNEAIELYMKIKQHLDNKLLLMQIGKCYENLKQYELSLEYYQKAHNLDKNDFIIYGKMGRMSLILKDYDKTLEYCCKAADSCPEIHESEKPKFYYNSSMAFLAKKMFKDGFNLNDFRLLPDVCSDTRIDMPFVKYWDGQTHCNNLLILHEQGIGDNIQYYRFILELSKLYPNMKITYLCNKIIHHIFKINAEINNLNIISTITKYELETCKYDYKTYICSLPNLIHIRDTTIDIQPNEENYIHINNEKLVYWKNVLNTNIQQKRKIGFVYKGALVSAVEKNIPLEEFKILLDLNIELICLHKKDDIQKDIDNITFKDKIQFLDIDKDLAFEDTICILKNIDLLITVDTAVVHLAGVLNVKTWLLLGKVSEWRWSDDEHTTYWYNSVELIRMKENKELKDILKTVKDKLLQEENKE